MQDLWRSVLGEIEITVSKGNYLTWFKNTSILKYEDSKVVIGVPNVFIKQHLERKYTGVIKDSLLNNGLEQPEIEFKIHTKTTKNEPVEPALSAADPEMPAVRSTASHLEKKTNSLSHSYRQGLNEKYTFDNFIVGSGNELAHAACQAVAAQPGSKYNPLFLYGGVGIGKTHLIQAVGNAVLANNKDAKIVYVSTEQFVQEFIDAVRFKKNTDFASHYRNADVLIIDDVQFIAGKDKTQEEFFHTFNALHQANKQIILSSDKPPRDIPTLEERLQSRFAWGMSIDMQVPDFETRCAIVKTKAVTHNVSLPPDVVDFLANHIQTNIRELEGALNQLLAFCEMRNLTPDANIANSLLGGQKTRPKHVSAKQLVEKVSRHFQLPIEDILGPRRDRDIVVPRQIAMYLLRSELHLSFPKIARELGRKDHTTAIHSVDKIAKELSYDVELKSTISELKERIYA
jgi:chromosomal replication initiator protein